MLLWRILPVSPKGIFSFFSFSFLLMASHHPTWSNIKRNKQKKSWANQQTRNPSSFLLRVPLLINTGLRTFLVARKRNSPLFFYSHLPTHKIKTNQNNEFISFLLFASFFVGMLYFFFLFHSLAASPSSSSYFIYFYFFSVSGCFRCRVFFYY